MKNANWKILVVVAMAASLIVAWGCAKKEMPANEGMAAATEEAVTAETEAAEPSQAVASLERGPDMAPVGSVMFTQEDGGIRVVAHLVGAPPGIHGLHVHDVGDCSAADFTSAGGHFNPTEAPHGGPDDMERHAGDLGNIEIGENGSGHLELVSTMLSLGDGDNSVIGRGVILHANEDDLVSQPTGAAGARLACGVVVPVEGD